MPDHLERSSPHEPFRVWLAEKLDNYFKSGRDATPQEVATLVGVSIPTISRWRMGSVNVSQQHQTALFEILGITEETLAKAGVKAPAIRARGPTRSLRAAHAQPAGRWDRLQREISDSPPNALFTILGDCLGDHRLKWLKKDSMRERNELEKMLQSPGAETQLCMGHEEPAIKSAPQLTCDRLLDSLKKIRNSAQRGDMLLCYLWAELKRGDRGLELQFTQDGGSLAVGDLVKHLALTALKSMLVIEVFGGENDTELFGHRQDGRRCLLSDLCQDQAVIFAALPSVANQVHDWPHYSRLLRKGLSNGKVGCDRDGRVSVQALHDYAEETIFGVNRKALGKHAEGGTTTTTIPTPRLICATPNLIIGSRVKPDNGSR